MSKEAVHKGYMDAAKSEHSSKPIRPNRDRRALVIGAATDNIGEAIYSALEAQDFQRVYIPSPGEVDVTIDGDVTDYLERMGAVDTLVLCNGHTHMDWIEKYPSAEMYKVVNNSLVGSMIATSEFVASTIDHPWHKHIIYIGSMAHKGVLNASAPYCAAKAGLHHFVRCMGWELTPKGYTSIIVHPSNTEGTPMTEATIQHIERYREMSREDAEAYWASINLKDRWLAPRDIGDLIVDLVSGKFAFASGTAIELSGGQR